MSRSRGLVGYAWALAAAIACTVIGWLMRPRFELVNIVMVYLVAVLVVALRYSRGPAVATALLCVVTFDYFFVPPSGTLTVHDAQYLLTFAIMVGIALLISWLVESIRRESSAKAELEIQTETERIRSVLLASISHDLRTPLAVMAGASSSLAQSGERLTPEERQALANSVFEQAREMSDHVAKILQMTRLDSGAIALDRDWTSLQETLSSVLSRLAERLAANRVILEIAPDIPLVRVDAALIEQAIGNLLENAARHTPPGTVVRVRAQHRDDEVMITVEDYGGGIPEPEVERVFDKFHRGTLERGSGLGLGLAICRAIVRLHGGRAWAERVPAGGTAFHFTLAIEPAPPIPPEPGVS